MKKLSILAALLAVFTLNVQASVIVSYGGSSLGLFSDTGTLLTSYSTTLVNPQYVVTDNSGHVYVSEWGTGAYNGSVKMFDIASGAFIRNVITTSYNFTGLAFNPANPGEIIVMGQYSAAYSQLGRWNTSASDSNVGGNSALAPGYFGLYYNPTISGGAAEGIYIAHPGVGILQQFNSSTMDFVANLSGISNPNDITGVGTDLFIARADGKISKYSGGVFTDICDTLSNNYGISNDGTDLWVAQYGGQVAEYDTAGELLSYFPLTNPAGIAYTPIFQPIAVNNPSFEAAFTENPNTGWASSPVGGWAGAYDFTGVLSPIATDGTKAAYGNVGVAYQILTNHTVLAGTYKILIDVGHRNDGYYTDCSLGVYSVNLPGGAELLGNFTASNPSVGGWSTFETTIAITNGSPAIGGNLQLNLTSGGVQTVVDNVRVYVAPSAVLAPATLTSVKVVNGTDLQFTVSGSGTQVVQANTSLANPSGWTALYTNTAPFVFTDTNAVALHTGRLYRALAR